MPRRRLPPRLYLDPTREEWTVRDGARFIRTGCGKGELGKAERFLASYIGEKYKPEPSGTPLIADILRLYADEVVPERRTGTKTIVYNIGVLLKWWGDKKVSQITSESCKEYAATQTASMAREQLKSLMAACRYWDKSKFGPLASKPVFSMPPPNPPRERWLTRSEAARLLNAARRCLHLRRMILLGLYTGSRPGIILALRWSQVDLRAGVLSRIPRGATEAKNKKAPKVRLGRRILTHLRRWKRIDGDNVIFVCHYQGRQVDDPHAAWDRIVTAANLPDVTRHTLRHTRATWLMQKGVDLFQAAGHLGMSVKTLTSVYGHHHPDWQEEAANI